MVIETRSDLSEAVIMHRATEYFVGEVGLGLISSTSRAVSYGGDRGAVNLTVDDDGPDTVVQLIAEGVEEEANRFIQRITQGVGVPGGDSPASG